MKCFRQIALTIAIMSTVGSMKAIYPFPIFIGSTAFVVWLTQKIEKQEKAELEERRRKFPILTRHIQPKVLSGNDEVDVLIHVNPKEDVYKKEISLISANGTGTIYKIENNEHSCKDTNGRNITTNNHICQKLKEVLDSVPGYNLKNISNIGKDVILSENVNNYDRQPANISLKVNDTWCHNYTDSNSDVCKQLNEYCEQLGFDLDKEIKNN